MSLGDRSSKLAASLASLLGGSSWLPGGNIGSQVGNIAGQVFGLEVEGMSPEDQELQVARRFVRLAGEAANQVAQAPPSAPPQQAARTALAGRTIIPLGV